MKWDIHNELVMESPDDINQKFILSPEPLTAVKSLNLVRKVQSNGLMYLPFPEL